MSDSSSSRAKDLTAEEWGTNASAAPETLLHPGSSNTGSSRFVYGVRVLQPAGRDACFPQGTTCASQRRGPYRGWSLCISKVTLWNSRIWLLEGTFQPVSLDPLSLQMLRLRLREGKWSVLRPCIRDALGLLFWVSTAFCTGRVLCTSEVRSGHCWAGILL